MINFFEWLIWKEKQDQTLKGIEVHNMIYIKFSDDYFTSKTQNHGTDNYSLFPTEIGEN